MPDLSEQLLHPERRESVVADACDLIDDEVGRASGASGLALRSAYRVVRKVRPGAVPQVVNELLPQFARQVDRYHQESRETGRPLADVLNDDPGEVADALLSVADARVERSSKGSVRAAYRRVRGVAERHVVAALPAAAALVDKHVQPDDPSQVP